MDLTRDLESAAERPVPPAASQRRRGAGGRAATVFVTQRLSSSPPHAFNAWVDPAIAGQWLFATALQPMTQVQIDPRAGGAFRLSDGCADVHCGRFIEIAAPQRLVFDLLLGETLSRVEVGIAPLARGCRVDLTHHGVPPGRARHTEARWIGMFYGLALLLDSDL